MQSVAFIIGFIYGLSICFKSCDCRSEGVVPANTLKRLVRKIIFFIKIVFGGRIRTPTDEEKYKRISDALSIELLQIMDHSLRFNPLKNK